MASSDNGGAGVDVGGGIDLVAVEVALLPTEVGKLVEVQRIQSKKPVRKRKLLSLVLTHLAHVYE